MTNTADSRNAMTENVPVEWGDSSEVQRQHEMELREARARVTQMEKTMKWWADCCGNWREKWAKVRNDRNKAREEIKQLRVQLATSKKEIEDFKNKNSLLESEIAQIKQDNDKKTSPSTDGLNNENNEDGLVTKSDLFIPDSMPANDKQNNEIQQQISILKLRLEEAKTTIAAERSEKNAVHKTLEKLRQELEEIREKCDELRAAKKDAIRELLTAQEEHRAELRLVNNSVNEEVAARESLEKKLCDLRVELEKLQAENAAEWGKRERLETEKITMDRENKKLRSELLDLQDRMERKGRPISNSDLEIRSLQQEIADKLKENNDLKHSNNKLKKMLFEANTEMGHAHRRAEQYEGEVKTLRTRVEELKRELCAVEDELDSVSNQARRFQRINEEMRVEMAKFQSSGLSMNSPKHYKYKGLPNEYKPNIHELKQLFDDTKRSTKNRKQAGNQMAYADAKPTTIDPDLNGFAMRQRNSFNFEKTKQKFDNGPRQNSHAKSQSSNIPKRKYPEYGELEAYTNAAFGDEKLEDNSFSMTSSVNLDGLKVSDDE